MTDFDRYKSLKEKFNFVYEGICLNRVLALPIWFVANGGYNFSWKRIALAFLAIDVKKMKFNPQRNTILSTYGRYVRKDHLELYNTVLKRLDEEASYNNSLTFGWKLSVHPIVICQVLKFVFINLRDTSLSLWSKWKLIIECIHYCNIIEELKYMDFTGVQKYLCQCSVLDLENLLTQFFKLRNIPTYSLQEGVYFIFKKNPPLDSIQYENFETDNLLCWGQFSVDEYISYGISPKRLSLAGYPKKVELHTMKKDNSYKKCMVLIARDSFQATNMKLLEMLSKVSFNCCFELKLHPSCDLSYYSEYARTCHMHVIPKDATIDECLNNIEYDFSIAINTTAYYEALMRGLPCLRFYDGTFDLMSGYKDVFETLEGFLECLGGIRSLAEDEYQKEIDNVLKYAIGVEIDNYQKILCK